MTCIENLKAISEITIDDNNLRESFSFGCSVAIKKNVTLQASYDNYIWNYDGSPENFDKISIGVSLHEIPGI